MGTAFKVYYGGTPATKAQLDAIEEIVVEQQIGRVWEARIRIPICLNEDGAWEGEHDAAYEQFARVRIEARIGNGDFVPLIDGRITSQDPGLMAEPGHSTLVLTVQDDTTLLHRLAVSESIAGRSDSDIVSSVFNSAELGGQVEVDDTGGPVDRAAHVRRAGTAMQLLRTLMRRHRDMYAYVLPGESPGTSDCFFKRLPTSPDPGLPDLVLTGPERNISGFNLRRLSNAATRYEGDSLNAADLSISSGESSSADAAAAEGEGATAAPAAEIRTRRLPAGIGDHVDISEVAEGAALAASYTISADGSVLPHRYGAILSPYKRVRARLSNTRYSTSYVIFSVTHTLGVSEYTQAFSVRGNAVAPASGAGAGAATRIH